MNDRLQDFSFKKSVYERPTRRWVCGRASDGTACHAGPSEAGQCWFAGRTDCGNGQYECAPSSGKDGATCTRPRHLGGKCDEGPCPDGSCARPIPCQPIRSNRSIRRGLVFAVLAATLGFVAFIWSSPRWHRSFGSPGQLTHAHASVLADQGPLNQQCGYCHSNASGQDATPSEALSRIDTHANETRRCLSCHNMGTLDTAMRAHGLAARRSPSNRVTGRRATVPAGSPTMNPAHAQRVRLSSMTLGVALTSMATPASDGLASTSLVDPGDVACASCHREHRGRDAALSEMQPTQCQNCHAVGFDSFADGHPRLLNDFDPQQPRLLNYDHAAHLEDYLDLEQPWRPSACALCHTPDREASHMVLNGFETACSECHSQDIYDDDDSVGIIFLEGFDRVTASADGSRMTAGPLPPFMTLLLLGSDSYPSGHDVEADLAAFEAIRRGEQNPLLSENPAKIKDRLAQAATQLFHDLDSREALTERLERAARTPLSDAQIDGLTGRLLEQTPIRNAGKIWSSGSTTGETETVAGGNWTRFDDTHRLAYLPRDHADPFMKAWYDLAVTAGVAHDGRGVRFNAAAAIRDLLTAPDAPGRCFKCHSPRLAETGIQARLVGDGIAGAVTQPPEVAWTASNRTDSDRKLTRFAHAPHLGLLDGRCYECHTKGSKTTTTMQIAANGGATVPAHRDFDPIGLHTCATCHTPQRAGDNCSLCHQYHMTPAAPVLSLRGVSPL